MYRKLFAGTYLYLIHVENKGSLVFSNYYAYSALMVLTFFHVLFFAGIAVAVQRPQLILSAGLNVFIAISIFWVGWLIFVRGAKYKNIIAEYKDRKSSSVKFAIVTNLLMGSLIFIMGVRAVIGGL